MIKKHYTSDINFEKKYFRISKTISTEKNKPVKKKQKMIKRE